MLFEPKKERTILSYFLCPESPRYGTYLNTISLFAVLGMVLSVAPIRAASQTQGSAQKHPGEAPVLVVGFVGGFVRVNDLRHSEVQLARQLQTTYGDRVQVRIFENRKKLKAHRWILDQLGKTQVSNAESDRNSRPCIILFGHSWGASAVIYLAQELERDRVPVALTIQVDSIAKDGQDDSLVPANVAEAINFYQTHGILHGRTAITAEDPSHTKILGNLRFNYKRTPPECRAYPWYDRLLFPGHTAIECDRRVWSQVEALISKRVPKITQPEQSVVAVRVNH